MTRIEHRNDILSADKKNHKTILKQTFVSTKVQLRKIFVKYTSTEPNSFHDQNHIVDDRKTESMENIIPIHRKNSNPLPLIFKPNSAIIASLLGSQETGNPLRQ